MPTYEYACTECGDQSEVIQKFTDDPLTVCAVCGGRLRKLFSPVGIVFKGSGFYRNDSRAPANESKQNGSRGSTETSADSKTADSKQGDSGSGDSGGGDSGSAAKSGDSGSAAPKSGDGKSGGSKSGSSSSKAKVA